MKKNGSGLVAIALLAVFAPTTTLAAGASGFPTWSSKFTKGRFTVLPLFGSAAVFDKETGLVWEKAPSPTALVWPGAEAHCNDLVISNRKGWRLPTIQELTSLLDTGSSDPALSTGHPFILDSSQKVGVYWSVTSLDGIPNDAWDMSLSNGIVDADTKSSTTRFVWCVRGGQGVDPQ